MDLDVFFQELKESLPSKAIDISESLELLKETINDTIEEIGVKVNESITTRDFEKVRYYSELAEHGHDYEIKIEKIIKMIDVEELTIKEESNESIDNKIIPNYDEYSVDNKIEHSLYENFTHIRPFGFKINNNELIESRTWQEVLIKTCECLFNKDNTKFLSFQNNKNMNGKKNKYFSTKSEYLRKPELVSNSIYIETNMSGNAIRNLIIKLLKEYGIKVSDYKVYFRADYRSLNKE